MDDVSLGFRASVPKERGFRNTFDLGAFWQGRKYRPEDDCAPLIISIHGEFQRFVTGDGIAGRDPVEIQSDNAWILVEATNSDDDETHWRHAADGWHYLLSGRRTYCVSFFDVGHWRCQDGRMNDRGQLVGFGGNDRGYDLPK